MILKCNRLYLKNVLRCRMTYRKHNRMQQTIWRVYGCVTLFFFETNGSSHVRDPEFAQPKNRIQYSNSRVEPIILFKLFLAFVPFLCHQQFSVLLMLIREVEHEHFVFLWYIFSFSSLSPLFGVILWFLFNFQNENFKRQKWKYRVRTGMKTETRKYATTLCLLLRSNNACATWLSCPPTWKVLISSKGTNCCRDMKWAWRVDGPFWDDTKRDSVHWTHTRPVSILPVLLSATDFPLALHLISFNVEAKKTQTKWNYTTNRNE